MMFSPRKCLLLLSMLVLAGGGFPRISLAVEPAYAPLVTIRFNQPHVYYEQALQGAVAKALKAKPDVMFDVVSFAPSTGDAVLDKQWQTSAGRNTKAVIAAMTSMGVSAQQISVSGRMRSGLRYDETQIFVR